MNLLSRVWYQLTQARQSSVRGIAPTDDPYVIRLSMAVEALTHLGLLTRSNLQVEAPYAAAETGYVLNALALQAIGIPIQPGREEMVAVVAQSQLLVIWELEQRFNNFGVAAWLYRAGYFAPTEELLATGLLNAALRYVDANAPTPPSLTYLNGMIATYTSFQIKSANNGKVLNVSRDIEPVVAASADPLELSEIIAEPTEGLKNNSSEEASSHESS